MNIFTSSSHGSGEYYNGSYHKGESGNIVVTSTVDIHDASSSALSTTTISDLYPSFIVDEFNSIADEGLFAEIRRGPIDDTFTHSLRNGIDNAICGSKSDGAHECDHLYVEGKIVGGISRCKSDIDVESQCYDSESIEFDSEKHYDSSNKQRQKLDNSDIDLYYNNEGNSISLENVTAVNEGKGEEEEEENKLIIPSIAKKDHCLVISDINTESLVTETPFGKLVTKNIIKYSPPSLDGIVHIKKVKKEINTDKSDRDNNNRLYRTTTTTTSVNRLQAFLYKVKVLFESKMLGRNTASITAIEEEERMATQAYTDDDGDDDDDDDRDTTHNDYYDQLDFLHIGDDIGNASTVKNEDKRIFHDENETNGEGVDHHDDGGDIEEMKRGVTARQMRRKLGRAIDGIEDEKIFSTYIDDGIMDNVDSPRVVVVRLTNMSKAILRWTNSLLAFALFATAFFSVLPIKYIVGETFQGFSYYNSETDQYEPYAVYAGPVRIDAIIPVFLFVQALFYLAAALFSWKVITVYDYFDLIMRRLNPLMWVCNAITFPWVTMVIALVAGIREVTTICFLIVCTMTIYFTFSSIEFIQYYIRTRSRAAQLIFRDIDMLLTVYVPIIMTTLLFVISWAVIITYHAVSVEYAPGGETIPNWASACIYIGFFTQFVSVFGNLFIYICICWTRRKYLIYTCTTAIMSTIGNIVVGLIVIFANLD